jgi:MFS superfamily sulfate permease-like transporter
VGSRLWPRWPVLLVGMLAATAVVAVFSLQDVGIQVVGESATGLPSLAVPALSAADLPALMLAAVGVVIVGYSDNVLTARAFASRRREQIDSNTELLALGTANLASGLLRGFPVSSSGSRTAVANAQGSQTQLYSLTALALVLLVLAVGGAVLAGFPTAALGTVVIFAAISLIDLPAFRRLKEVRRSELVLALATTAAVLVLGVLYGVLAAVALSIVDLLRRISRPHDGILGYVPEVAGMHDVDDYPDARPVPGLVVYRYDAPLFFANAEDFRRRALAAVRDAPTDPHWLLLNVEAIIEVDSTAIDALEALRAELTDRGIVFAMARVKQDLRADLRPSGFLDAVGEDRIFMTLPTAVAAYEKWHEQRFGRPPHDDPA